MNFIRSRYSLEQAVDRISDLLSESFTIDDLLTQDKTLFKTNINLFIKDKSNCFYIKTEDYKEIWCDPLGCRAFIRKSAETEMIHSSKVVIGINPYAWRSGGDGKYVFLEKVRQKQSTVNMLKYCGAFYFNQDTGKKMKGFGVVLPASEVHARDADAVKQWASENDLGLDFYYEVQKSETEIDGKWEDSTFYTYGNQIQVQPNNSLFFDVSEKHSSIKIEYDDIFIPNFELERYIKTLNPALEEEKPQVAQAESDKSKVKFLSNEDTKSNNIPYPERDCSEFTILLIDIGNKLNAAAPAKVLRELEINYENYGVTANFCCGGANEGKIESFTYKHETLDEKQIKDRYYQHYKKRT